MARRKKEECKTAPAWLTSFSDLMSLLLTFFILLYSMSTLDVTKAIKFLSYFQGEKAKSFETLSVVKPINIYTEDIAKKVKKIIKRILPISAYQIVATKKYVLIRLFSDITFKENSVELSPKAKRALDELAKMIKGLKGNYQIRIEGHTSKDEPTKPMEKIRDEWDLSIQRATAAAEHLILNGIEPSRIVVVGYGAQKPLYTWNNPILQARNRRVEIYIEVDAPEREKKEEVIIKKKEKLPSPPEQKKEE